MYEDRTLVCRDCGESFIFSGGEQRFFAEKGLVNTPQRCPNCRAVAKRARTGGPRVAVFHDAIPLLHPELTRRTPEAQMGALVQLDASPFPWFGPGGPSLALHGAIDDATGTGLAYQWYKGETVLPAFRNARNSELAATPSPLA